MIPDANLTRSKQLTGPQSSLTQENQREEILRCEWFNCKLLRLIPTIESKENMTNSIWDLDELENELSDILLKVIKCLHAKVWAWLKTRILYDYTTKMFSYWWLQHVLTDAQHYCIGRQEALHSVPNNPIVMLQPIIMLRGSAVPLRFPAVVNYFLLERFLSAARVLNLCTF